jgi:hypothetical protein
MLQKHGFPAAVHHRHFKTSSHSKNVARFKSRFLDIHKKALSAPNIHWPPFDAGAPALDAGSNAERKESSVRLFVCLLVCQLHAVLAISLTGHALETRVKDSEISLRWGAMVARHLSMPLLLIFSPCMRRDSDAQRPTEKFVEA